MSSTPATTNLRALALAAWAAQQHQSHTQAEEQAQRLTADVIDQLERKFGVQVRPDQITVDSSQQHATIHFDGVELEYPGPNPNDRPGFWLYSPCSVNGCPIPAPFGPARDLAELGQLLSLTHRRPCERHTLDEDDTPEARLAQAVRDLVDERLAQQEE
jgi:hypothetical protein